MPSGPSIGGIFDPLATYPQLGLSGPIYDAAGINRVILVSSPKTIVDGSATALFRVACAPSSQVGGMAFYMVRATNNTDFQAMSGMIAYASVNKAASFTSTITDVTANNAKAVSSGTLTLAWTISTTAGVITVNLQPTGSLTEVPPYDVTLTIFPLIGVVTLV